MTLQIITQEDRLFQLHLTQLQLNIILLTKNDSNLLESHAIYKTTSNSVRCSVLHLYALKNCYLKTSFKS